MTTKYISIAFSPQCINFKLLALGYDLFDTFFFQAVMNVFAPQELFTWYESFPFMVIRIVYKAFIDNM